MEITYKIKVSEHNGFTEFKNAMRKGHKIDCYFGRHRFLYYYENYVVSLIEVKDFEHNWKWEIYCVEGKLFEDTEQFEHKQDADDKIIKMFEEAIYNKL